MHFKNAPQTVREAPGPQKYDPAASANAVGLRKPFTTWQIGGMSPRQLMVVNVAETSDKIPAGTLERGGRQQIAVA